MKKFLCLILPLIILCGCQKTSKIQKNISTYFPFYQNKIYVYTGSGSNFTDQKIFTMYTDENKMQRRLDMGTMVMMQVFENINGQLKYSNVAVDMFHLENMLNASNTDTFIELQEPFEVGNSWNFSDTTDLKKQITDMDAKVETPYASFDNAMEVTTKFSDDMTTKDYYVPDVGFVKSVSESSDGPIVIQLSQIINDTPLELENTIYKVDENAQDLSTDSFNLKFYTNDNLSENILEVMKENGLVSNETTINKFEINRDDLQNQIISVDFNSGFIDLTKLGSQGESLTLQAITNTLGHIFGVDKIKLTVDGKNYESGHISMEDGEYFDVK